MRLPSLTVLLSVAAYITSSYAFAIPPDAKFNLDERAGASDKLVFCHFMVCYMSHFLVSLAHARINLQIGIVADRTSAADYDADMQRAKSLGIDAFALNIGVDPYTDQQLGYAYQSAANNGMKVSGLFTVAFILPRRDQ